jgi:hypothetical protein
LPPKNPDYLINEDEWNMWKNFAMKIDDPTLWESMLEFYELRVDTPYVTDIQAENYIIVKYKVPVWEGVPVKSD